MLDALRELLREAAAEGAKRALAEVSLQSESYVDLKASGLYRPALRAIKRGELAAFKPTGSRKYLVRRLDWERWIESPGHRVQATQEPAAPEPDEVSEVIQANAKRRRRRGGP